MQAHQHRAGGLAREKGRRVLRGSGPPKARTAPVISRLVPSIALSVRGSSWSSFSWNSLTRLALSASLYYGLTSLGKDLNSTFRESWPVFFLSASLRKRVKVPRIT